MAYDSAQQTRLYEISNKIKLIKETLKIASGIKWPKITTKRASNAKAQFESGKRLLQQSSEELLREIYQKQ